MDLNILNWFHKAHKEIEAVTEEAKFQVPYRPKAKHIIDDHKVRAKKEWKCDHCQRTIYKGQLYRRVVWQGEARGFHCDHVHVRCY